MTNDQSYRAALSSLQIAGPNTWRCLISRLGSPERLWTATEKRLQQASMPAKWISRFLVARQQNPLPRLVDQLHTATMTVIAEDDQHYPTLLRQISDPPLVLFVRGNQSVLTAALAISIVGSRTISRYGETATDRLVRPLSRAGVSIVSGLALGVDGWAHRAALQETGPTIAVLAGGLDWQSISPKQHHRLAQKIIQQGGALISEQAPGTVSYKGHFPLRNRIIAGMTPATIVVEATAKSGALITANQALDQGRDVWAVPGPITQTGSVGPNRLISQGALPAISANAIMDHYGWHPSTETIARQLTADQVRLVQLLKQEPQTVDQILAHTGWPAGQLLATLTELEIGQQVRRQGDQFSLEVDKLN